jgi:mitochondrial fission protein ELM1
MKAERKLVRSCEHVILLNDKIRGLTKRYQKARAEGFKSFRYNIRIRLAAVEGVRNMYYEYARDRAEEVAELRKELYDQNVTIVAGNDDSDADDEFDTYSDMASSDEDYSSMETDDEETND